MAGDLRDILNQVRETHGRLTQSTVLEAATPEDHPLHHRFEWDDGIAGHKYRLIQAGNLLRVKFKHDREDRDPVDLRAFWPVRAASDGSIDEDAPDTEYLPTEEVLADPVARQVVLNAAMREANAFRRRYEHLQEYDSIVQAHLLGGDNGGGEQQAS